MSEHEHSTSLPPGSRIDNYVIERKLGGGGFSLVYLARVAEGKQRVVIKEYMPQKLATRDQGDMTVHAGDEEAAESFAYGRRLFFQEASTLATIKHPNIINVINFFRANGTVYMVMAYEKGVNLQAYIRHHNGGLSEKLIRAVFPPLLDALRLIHSMGLLHLDIKPGNIYLRANANPLLLDFGAVHQMLQSREFQPTQVITPGFAPYEQHKRGGYVGPWSDLYAIGATMRACIDGQTPPSAEERYLKDEMKPALELYRRSYSRSLLSAIDWAMEVDPELRPQNVDELLEALNREDDPDEPAPEPEQPQGESMLERLANSLPWSKG